MGNCNGVDKCCGRAGTHEEMKNFYDKPMPFTPVKGRSIRMLSTGMSEEDTPPFGEKQVQAHGWIYISKAPEVKDISNSLE